jgi:hypothetical protein
VDAVRQLDQVAAAAPHGVLHGGRRAGSGHWGSISPLARRS